MKTLFAILFAVLTISQTNPVTNPIQHTQHTQYTFEDFRIISVTPSGEIRGELIQGTGEGIFLIESDLQSIQDAPQRLSVGDEIEVAWTTFDYDNSIWDDIRSIEFIN